MFSTATTTMIATRFLRPGAQQVMAKLWIVSSVDMLVMTYMSLPVISRPVARELPSRVSNCSLKPSRGCGCRLYRGFVPRACR